MSVLKRYRYPTNADYVAATWDLRTYTLKTCVRFPKRYKEWVTDYIVKLSAQAHIYADAANRIYPKKKEDYEKRKEFLQNAKLALKEMWPQIDLAYTTFKMDSSEEGRKNSQILEEWLPKLEYAEDKIKAIMESDRKRFGNLK